MATYIFKKSYSFSKKHVLITAGPTYESIDPVRYIGNASSGKMGIALADSMADQGAQVTLVLGPSSLMPASPRVEVIRVRSALDMLHATSTHHATADICIFAAAVADYRPVTTAREKIKKTGNELDLKLIKNPDIAQNPSRWLPSPTSRVITPRSSGVISRRVASPGPSLPWRRPVVRVSSWVRASGSSLRKGYSTWR